MMRPEISYLISGSLGASFSLYTNTRMANSSSKLGAFLALLTIGLGLLCLGNIWAAGIGCILIVVSTPNSVRRWKLKPMANSIYLTICGIGLILMWYYIRPSWEILTAAWLACVISEIYEWRKLSANAELQQ
jgi:hypothetical protein